MRERGAQSIGTARHAREGRAINRRPVKRVRYAVRRAGESVKATHSLHVHAVWSITVAAEPVASSGFWALFARGPFNAMKKDIVGIRFARPSRLRGGSATPPYSIVLTIVKGVRRCPQSFKAGKTTRRGQRGQQMRKGVQPATREGAAPTSTRHPLR